MNSKIVDHVRLPIFEIVHMVGSHHALLALALAVGLAYLALVLRNIFHSQLHWIWCSV